jgi:hypothetical protein
MGLPIRPTMALGRIGAGALSWANPPMSAKVFGVKGDPSAYLARLFGIRDIALGLGVLSRNPTIRKSTLRMGIMIDTLDTAAGVLEARDGKLTLAGTALLVGGAASFIALGAIALSREE